MNEDRTIAWESIVIDFLKDDDDEDEDHDFEDEEDEEEEGYQDSHSALQEMMMRRIKIPVRQLFNTPLGILDINQKLNPYRNYEMWIMHTNFNITKPVVAALNEAYGVEILHVLGRYRCLIGIGRLFNFRDVRINIERLLGVTGQVKPTPEFQAELAKAQEYPYYGVCMLPNGFIETVHSQDMTPELEARLAEFKEAEKLGNVLVVTHENV